ncbi:DUF5020 family protein [Catenovulum sp. 2E275]|uniref:DUF5020 family protein n=1 Tax=Catenovulum sp. 2E275 TaxID=2980497 RepID=UPI0021CF2C36|nr:DUF5020 family protein [Catenovulum sp. 2E275]MCU4674364.1 DUF5020 family protein [Catenovulum sp. 2E275]
MKFKTLLSFACMASSVVGAETVIAKPIWSDNSISLLHGENHSDFYSDSSEQNVVTLEHISGYKWGGVFFFLDRTEKKDAPTGFAKYDTYGEISPDISLSYLTGSELKFGAVKDVTLSATYEFGGQMDNFLYGVGLNWDFAAFKHFSSKLYYAANDTTKNDVQLTLVWGYQLPLEAIEVSFDGYLDWSSARSDHKADFHFNPQLLVNLSPYIGLTDSKLEAGFEYSYWKNKYGLDILEDESVFSLMVKYHL